MYNKLPLRYLKFFLHSKVLEILCVFYIRINLDANFLIVLELYLDFIKFAVGNVDSLLKLF